MKKIVKKLLIALMCLALIQPVVMPTEAQAATVKLNKTGMKLTIGKSTYLKLTGTKKTPVWKSSNPKVASVTSKGKVTALKSGKSIVTAKLGGKTYRCGVNVVPDYNGIYNKYLSSHHSTIKWYYIINVDKKGAPEMVTTKAGGGMTSYDVYTISGNKVRKIGSYGARGINMWNPTFTYVSSEKCLMAEGWTNGIGGVWGNLYGISGGKLATKYHARESHSRADVYYTGTNDKNAKQVSKSAYIS